MCSCLAIVNDPLGRWRHYASVSIDVITDDFAEIDPLSKAGSTEWYLLQRCSGSGEFV